MKNKIYSSFNWINSQKIIYAFLFIYIVSCFIFSDKGFFSFVTFNNILKRAGGECGIVALGMSFVMLTGNVDLSVGSVVALSATVAALLTKINPVVAIFGGILVGVLAGLLNGVLIAKLKLSSFIITLSTLLGLRGIVYIITKRDTIPITNDFYNSISTIKIFNVNIMGVIFIFLTLICMFIAHNTKLGLSLYAVGGNENAANLMGIRIDNITITAYVICGLFAGINGVLLSSKLYAAQSVAADGWETTAIACAALGGIKLSGGEGKFSGTFFGTMVIAIINTWFNYAGNISAWWSKAIMGLILIISVAIQSEYLGSKTIAIKKWFTGSCKRGLQDSIK